MNAQPSRIAPVVAEDPLWDEPAEPSRRPAGVETVLFYLALPVLFLLIGWPGAEGAGLLRNVGRLYLQHLIIVGCIGAALEGLYRLAARLVRRRLGGFRRFVGHVVVIGAGVLAGGEVAARILTAAFDLPLAVIRPVVWRAGFVVSGTIVAILLGYDRLRARAWRLRLAEELARLAAVRAELTALQARTNPHFLFNSLNSVAGLIGEDPARAETVLERLSSLFRYVLESSKRASVPLREEVSAAEAYLAVEAIRFEGRLRSRVEVGPGLDQVPVPPLVLQPLAENAVLHGIASQRQPGTVEISVRRQGADLVITVADDGAGAPAGSGAGAGSALTDLAARLRLLHGERASLEHGPAEPRGYRARVVLPLAPAVET